MNYCGIDPGASGGFALLKGDDLLVCEMPDTPEAIWSLIRTIPVDAAIVMEQVGGYVGGAGNPGSAMFNFGQNYGMLKMALTGVGLTYDLVTPAVWQRELGIEKRRWGENKTAWKNRLKNHAFRLFPDEIHTLRTCDAALIAAYAMLKWTKANAVTGTPPEAQAIR